MVAAVMLIALVASTGLGVAINLTADGTPSVESHEAFDVVDPIGPTRGETETAIGAARLTADGNLQVLVEGNSCSAFTWAQTAETQTDVQVRAFIWSDPSLCPAPTVPWFVAVRLERPLSSRTLWVGPNSKELDVVDCRAIPDADICRVGETSTL